MLPGRRLAVFVDCALMGEPPGTLRRFRPAGVASVKAQPGISLHDGDLLDTIRLVQAIEPVAKAVGKTL